MQSVQCLELVWSFTNILSPSSSTPVKFVKELKVLVKRKGTVFKIETGEINDKCCVFVGVNHLSAAVIPRTGESGLVGGVAVLRRLRDPPGRASVCLRPVPAPDPKAGGSWAFAGAQRPGRATVLPGSFLGLPGPPADQIHSLDVRPPPSSGARLIHAFIHSPSAPGTVLGSGTPRGATS